MPTAVISIVVPDLPDADVWFANNAAWSTYWKGITGEVELDPAETTIYVPVTYNPALLDVRYYNIDGIDYQVITIEMFNLLLQKVNAIDTILQNMRSEMKDAGYITEAQ